MIVSLEVKCFSSQALNFKQKLNLRSNKGCKRQRTLESTFQVQLLFADFTYLVDKFSTQLSKITPPAPSHPPTKKKKPM